MSTLDRESRRAKNLSRIKELQRSLVSIVSAPHEGGLSEDRREHYTHDISDYSSSRLHSRPRELTYGPATDLSNIQPSRSSVLRSGSTGAKFLCSSQREVERLVQEKHDLIQQCMEKDALIEDLQERLGQPPIDTSHDVTDAATTTATAVTTGELQSLATVAQEYFPEEAEKVGLRDDVMDHLRGLTDLLRTLRDAPLLPCPSTPPVEAGAAALETTNQHAVMEEELCELREQIEQLREEKKRDCDKLVDITERLEVAQTQERETRESHSKELDSLKHQIEDLTRVAELASKKNNELTEVNAELQSKNRELVGALQQKELESTTHLNELQRLCEEASENQRQASLDKEHLSTELEQYIEAHRSLEAEYTMKSNAASGLEIGLSELHARQTLDKDECVARNVIYADFVKPLLASYAPMHSITRADYGIENEDNNNWALENSNLAEQSSMASNDMSVVSDLDSEARRNQQSLKRASREKQALKRKLGICTHELSETKNSLMQANGEIQQLTDKITFLEAAQQRASASPVKEAVDPASAAVVENGTSSKNDDKANFLLNFEEANIDSVEVPESQIIRAWLDDVTFNTVKTFIATNGSESQLSSVQALGYFYCVGDAVSRELKLKGDSWSDKQAGIFWKCLLTQTQHYLDLQEHTTFLLSGDSLKMFFYLCTVLPMTIKGKLQNDDLSSSFCAAIIQCLPEVHAMAILKHTVSFAGIEWDDPVITRCVEITKAVTLFAPSDVLTTLIVNRDTSSDGLPDSDASAGVDNRWLRLVLQLCRYSFCFHTPAEVAFVKTSFEEYCCGRAALPAQQLVNHMDGFLTPLAMCLYVKCFSCERVLVNLLQKLRPHLVSLCSKEEKTQILHEKQLNAWLEAIASVASGQEIQQHSDSPTTGNDLAAQLEAAQRKMLQLYKENTTYLSHIELLISEIEAK